MYKSINTEKELCYVAACNLESCIQFPLRGQYEEEEGPMNKTVYRNVHPPRLIQPASGKPHTFLYSFHLYIGFSAVPRRRPFVR